MSNFTFKELKKHFSDSLAQIYEQSEIDALFFRLFEDIFDIQKFQIQLDYNNKVPEQQLEILLNSLSRLQASEPLQYITQKAYFLDLELYVSPSVLIPRPETEELVKHILRENREKPRIIDIGTGSGCISISLAKFIYDSEVVAIDISKNAIDTAQLNATKYGVNIDFKQLDIFEILDSDFPQKFDIIVSNPPYVTESDKANMQNNVLLYEPKNALFVPDSSALKYYNAIAKFAETNLAKKGIVWVEINERFGNETCDVFAQYFSNVKLYNDFRDKSRFVRATNT
ncbi:MAG: peptide chain release factor N(5)-glutamine methyltransferase [Salinivirgaceae bacterium]|jgi:release factor glutamine methyltransferase|nr:peptide chain release factor N(5)-glutamine methyltransferase [Bacteroidales bacterium]